MLINKKIFNISNLLSISRVLVLPLVVPIIKKDYINYNIAVIGILVFMLLTDFLDGFLARKLNIVTSLGKILDPLADKIVIIVITYLITKYRGFPVWAFYIIAGREFFILSGAIILFKKRHILVTSNLIGKVSVFFISCSILGYIFFESKTTAIPFVLLLIGIFLYLISFASYTIRYLRLMEVIPKLMKYKIFKDSRFF